MQSSVFLLVVLALLLPVRSLATTIRIGWDIRLGPNFQQHLAELSSQLRAGATPPMQLATRPLAVGRGGDEPSSLLDALHRGQLDLAIVPMSQLPTTNIVALEYASFGMGATESAFVFDSNFAEAALERLAEFGFRGLALWNAAPTYFASKSPITDAADFKGKRIGASPAGTSSAVFSTLGASSVEIGSAIASKAAAFDGFDLLEVRAPDLQKIVAAGRPRLTYFSTASNSGFALVASSRYMGKLSVAERGHLELAVSAATQTLRSKADGARRDFEKRLQDLEGAVYVTTTPEIQNVVLGRATELSGGRWRGKPVNLPDDLQPVPILYVTNREATTQEGAVIGYTGERRRDEAVSYGVAVVGVNRKARFAGYGSWFQKTYFVLERLMEGEVKGATRILRGGPYAEPMFQAEEEDRFFSETSATLMELPKKERMALVFVHGYNTPFVDALGMAAQLSIDLKIPGLTILFSWPSAGSYGRYAADEASVAASELELARLISRLHEQQGVDRIVLISHSMGSRAVLRAFREVTALHKVPRLSKVQHVIFAAPDEDITVFRRHASAIAERAGRTTLYSSQKDRALLISQEIHNYPRAGLHPPLMLMPRVDTIAVHDVDKTLSGHGYVVDNEAVMYDMHALIYTGEAPEKRPRVIRKIEKGQPYFEIRH
jgi:esterase/lipase superfamily enzyme